MAVSPTFRKDVQQAYRTFHEREYRTPFGDLPVKAQAALKKWAAGDIDVAEFTTKTVDGKKTFAAYVPSTDSGDVDIVDTSGRVLARGTIQSGNAAFDWNSLSRQHVVVKK